MTINNVNDRPTLNTSGSPLLTSVLPSVVDPTGSTVANLVGLSITDPDTGALFGIAITSATTSLGTWQYSLNGTTWIDVGVVSAKSALLLRAEDHVRLLPSAGKRGTAAFSYRAWDQTSGSVAEKANTALTTATAFSLLTETAMVLINTAPKLVV